MDVTAPFVMLHVADAALVAVVPPPMMEIIGSVVYPDPPLVTLMEMTLPSIDVVAEAGVPSYCHST